MSTLNKRASQSRRTGAGPASAKPSVAQPLVEISRVGLVERVVAALVEYISTAGLQDGDRLPTEAKLSEMFGVSRLAMREAMIRLKSLGLIGARQGLGWYRTHFEPADSFRLLAPLLTNFTGADLQQIMEVRMLFEPFVAAAAANHRSKAATEQLRKCLSIMENNVANREVFIEYDIAFHRQLAIQAGNPILLALFSILTDLSRKAQQAYRDSVDDRARSVTFHRAIFEAVASGDAAAACQAMRDHAQNVWDSIERK
jgi:GntR family transcriptional repressor for pyruvate dehydrogenase complex